MKWKRSRKAKEQVALNTPLTGPERNGTDMHDAKPEGDSQSSSLEDEEELEEDDEDKKEEIMLRGCSLGSVGFVRQAVGGEMGKYSSYSEEELEEGGPRTRRGVFP